MRPADMAAEDSMKEAERRVTWASKLDSDLAGSCALAEADLAPTLYANTICSACTSQAELADGTQINFTKRKQSLDVTRKQALHMHRSAHG